MNIVPHLLAFGYFAILTAARGEGTENVPEITSNATTTDVSNDDIAFFTCSAQGHPVPSIRWLRAGNELKNSQKGVKILSITSASQPVDSHLFVAVTSDSVRGEYVCEASSEVGKAQLTFVIEGSSTEQEVALNYIAIGLGVGLSTIIFGAMAFFITRAQWRLKAGQSAKTGGNDKPTTNGVIAEHMQLEDIQDETLEESFPTEETAMIQTSPV